MNTLKNLMLSAAAAAAGACALAGAGMLAAVPAQAAVAPEAFGELPLIHDAAISPDGSKVAIFVNMGGTYGVKVVRVDDPTDSPIGVLLPEDVKPAWVRWANDERVLLSVWQSQKTRGIPYTTGAIYTLDADSGDGDWLIKPRRQSSFGSNIGTDRDFFEQYYNTVVDWLHDDPDHILMTFMHEHPDRRDILKVDVATGRYESIERGSASVQGWTTDMDGTPRVKEGYDRNAKTSEDYGMEIKGTDGEWSSVDEYPGIDPKTVVYGFTSNPDEMVIGSRQGRNTQGLYVYDLAKRAVGRKLFHDDTYDVGNIVIDPEAGEVIGASYVGDVNETVLFDGYNSVLQDTREEFPQYQVHYVDSNDSGDTVLFKVTNGYEPGMLMMRRKGSDATMHIGEYNPSLPTAELGLVIPVKYTARDGQRIPSYVTLPPTVNDTEGIKALPFIVLPHGGPYARDSAEFDWFAQFFASRGYGVLQMNFRGSTGYGESFAQAGRESWKVMRDDVTDGARWLVEKGYADPERMCVAGWSYGGYAALMNGLQHPELFDCVVSIAGLSDIEGAIDQAREFKFGRLAREQLMSGFADRDDMKANSPVRLAEGMTLPTFIAHGEYDTRVQIDQHRKLRRRLKRAGVDLVELEFEDEDHFMSRQENRQTMMRELDKFLVSVNGPSEFMKP